MRTGTSSGPSPPVSSTALPAPVQPSIFGIELQGRNSGSQLQNGPRHPAHLGEGSEGSCLAQLLPALGHRLSRLLGGLGCFLHTLLDFPAKVAFTDFVKTLLRQKCGVGGCHHSTPRPGAQRHNELLLPQDPGTHIREHCLQFLGCCTLGQLAFPRMGRSPESPPQEQ